MKSNLTFIVKTAALYCTLAVGFSVIGIFLPERTLQMGHTPMFSIEEIGGHILWGLGAGAVTLSLRYFLLAGSFAILIDSDHLIGLLNIESVHRMSHSIAFGMISIIILMLLFGKKDYLLGASAFAGLLAHLSFDIFSGDTKFPIFTPIFSKMIEFPNVDWIFLEIAAVAVVGFAMFLTRKMPQKTILQ